MKAIKKMRAELEQEPTLALKVRANISQNTQRIHENKVMPEEEVLATLLYAQHRAQSSRPSFHYDENEVACAAKEWQEKGLAPTSLYDETLLQEASRVLAAEQKMQANSQKQLALPSILAYTLKESLSKTVKTTKRQKEEQSSAPAIIVELLQDSIKVFKSTFHGFGDVFQPVVQSRSAHPIRELADETEYDSENESLDEGVKALSLRANYALLHQKTKENYLQYELLRDSKHSITLLISAPECLRKSKAVLKQGERTIAAQGFNMENGLLKFKHLKVGEYRLEFCGVMEYNVNLFIRARLNAANTSTPAANLS